jgi:hypothetical protein
MAQAGGVRLAPAFPQAAKRPSVSFRHAGAVWVIEIAASWLRVSRIKSGIVRDNKSG